MAPEASSRRRRAAWLLPLIALAGASGRAPTTSFRVERNRQPAGALEASDRDGGWVEVLDKRGDALVRDELHYDEHGAIDSARFYPPRKPGEEEAPPLVAAFTDGDFALAVGDDKRAVTVPLTQRAKYKPGRTFVLVRALQPAVLLGCLPLAATSARADSEFGAVIIDAKDGIKAVPQFEPIKLVRDRKPRKVELADGTTVDAVSLDVVIKGVKLMTVVAGPDGTPYAYRIVAKDSPRFGEEGYSSRLR